MTRAELRKRVQERIASANGTPYSDGQIHDALNEGLHLFAFLSLCVERTAEIRLTPERPVWEMRTVLDGWIAPLRVKCRRYTVRSRTLFDEAEFDSVLFDEPSAVSHVTTAVRPARLSDLDARDDGWQNERGGTVEQYGCQGPDLFFVRPCPEDVQTNLILTYVAEPVPLTHDNQEPEIPDEDHPALVSYALASLPMEYGGSELARFEGEFQSFLTTVAARAIAVRNRSLAQRYDTIPAEFQLPDLSRKAKQAS